MVSEQQHSGTMEEVYMTPRMEKSFDNMERIIEEMKAEMRDHCSAMKNMVANMAVSIAAMSGQLRSRRRPSDSRSAPVCSHHGSTSPTSFPRLQSRFSSSESPTSSSPSPVPSTRSQMSHQSPAPLSTSPVNSHLSPYSSSSQVDSLSCSQVSWPKSSSSLLSSPQAVSPISQTSSLADVSSSQASSLAIPHNSSSLVFSHQAQISSLQTPQSESKPDESVIMESNPDYICEEQTAVEVVPKASTIAEHLSVSQGPILVVGSVAGVHGMNTNYVVAKKGFTQNIVRTISLDFGAWTACKEEIEKIDEENILKKYADHETCTGLGDKVVEVLESPHQQLDLYFEECKTRVDSRPLSEWPTDEEKESAAVYEGSETTIDARTIAEKAKGMTPVYILLLDGGVGFDNMVYILTNRRRLEKDVVHAENQDHDHLGDCVIILPNTLAKSWVQDDPQIISFDEFVFDNIDERKMHAINKFSAVITFQNLDKIFGPIPVKSLSSIMPLAVKNGWFFAPFKAETPHIMSALCERLLNYDEDLGKQFAAVLYYVAAEVTTRAAGFYLAEPLYDDICYKDEASSVIPGSSYVQFLPMLAVKDEKMKGQVMKVMGKQVGRYWEGRGSRMKMKFKIKAVSYHPP